jgi:hypothetical protein
LNGRKWLLIIKVEQSHKREPLGEMTKQERRIVDGLIKAGVPVIAGSRRIVQYTEMELEYPLVDGGESLDRLKKLYELEKDGVYAEFSIKPQEEGNL